MKNGIKASSEIAEKNNNEHENFQLIKKGRENEDMIEQKIVIENS